MGRKYAKRVGHVEFLNISMGSRAIISVRLPLMSTNQNKW